MEYHDIEKKYLDLFNEKIKSVFEYIESEFSKIRSGRVSPNLLDGIKVEYYEEFVPIHQIAQIQIPEPRKILIKPYEKNMVKSIMQAIVSSQIGVNPINDEDRIFLAFPSLTEEDRKISVKKIKVICDKAKQDARYLRRDLLQQLKNEEKEKKMSENITKILEEKLDNCVKDVNKEIDKHFDTKEKNLMTL